jgi:hypothetical protein
MLRNCTSTKGRRGSRGEGEGYCAPASHLLLQLPLLNLGPVWVVVPALGKLVLKLGIERLRYAMPPPQTSQKRAC